MSNTLFTGIAPSLRRVAPIVLSVLVLSACGGQAGLSAQSQSGFLGDSYDRLQQVPSEQSGVNIYRYKNPAFVLSNYKGLMIEPVVIYQSATSDAAGQGVTEETIQDVKTKINDALSGQAKQHFNVVTKPGPGIARLTVALTGAEALDEGLKPRNLIPVSAVITAASRVAGVQSKNAMIVVEAKLQDSVSGVTLGQSLYTVAGESFRLQSSSDQAFEALATKWVKTAVDQAVGQAAHSQ
jgi:hypothetical protein